MVPLKTFGPLTLDIKDIYAVQIQEVGRGAATATVRTRVRARHRVKGEDTLLAVYPLKDEPALKLLRFLDELSQANGAGRLDWVRAGSWFLRADRIRMIWRDPKDERQYLVLFSLWDERDGTDAESVVLSYEDGRALDLAMERREAELGNF